MQDDDRPEAAEGLYRDAEAGLRSKREALLDLRRDEVSRFGGLARAHAGRLARLGSNAAIAAGGLAMLALRLSEAFGDVDARVARFASRGVLVATVLCAIVARAVCGWHGRRQVTRESAALLRLTDDVPSDVERLQQLRVDAWARGVASRHLGPSVSLPVFALGLVVPLLLLHVRTELLDAWPVLIRRVLMEVGPVPYTYPQSQMAWLQQVSLYLLFYACLLCADTLRHAWRVARGKEPAGDTTSTIFRWFAGPFLGISIADLLEGFLPEASLVPVFYVSIGIAFVVTLWLLPRARRRIETRVREERSSMEAAAPASGSDDHPRPRGTED